MSRVERALNIERAVKFSFFFGSVVLLFLVITQIQNMLISFLMGFVTYFLLAPAVDLMERRGLSRTWSTVIPFAVLGGLIGFATFFLITDLSNQMKGLQENLPKYLENVNLQISKIETDLGGITKSVFHTDMQGKIQAQLTAWAAVFLEQLPNYLSTSFTILILAPFFAFFMLLNGSDFMRKLLALVPNNIFELVFNLQYQISSQMGGFIRARLIESIIVGVLIWGGMLALDFPYALILSIFAAVLNIIPYLGPLLGAAPAFLISFSNGGSSTEMVWLLVIFLAVQVVDTVILVPFLVARIVDLHPVTVVVAILIGSQLMGILGMIICIPVVSALKVTSVALYRHFTDFQS